MTLEETVLAPRRFLHRLAGLSREFDFVVHTPRRIQDRTQPRPSRSDDVEQQLESVIHVELLMAVEQRQAIHRRRDIRLDFPEALH
jgi:hypothetical protein